MKNFKKEVYNQEEFQQTQQELNCFNSFDFDQLKCKHSNSLLLYPENLDFLFISSQFHKHCPFVITSFYRSKKHPLTIQSPRSKHAEAIAFDCVPLKGNFKDFAILLFGALNKGKQAFPAIGLYSNHVHFDPLQRNNSNCYWVGKLNKNGGFDYEYFPDFWEMMTRYEILKRDGLI